VIGVMHLDAEPLRHIEHDRVFNLRDLGGYRTVEGRTTRWATLFRGDGLHRLDADDCAALGLRTVLDLRTEHEVTERGRLEVDGVDWHHLPVIRTMWEADWWTEESTPERFLADRYATMLDEGAEAIAGALRTLAHPDRLPAAFHCAAGKDRTGVLAAVILSLLGVDDDTIAADYGLSRLGMERLVEWVRTAYPDRVDTMADQPAVFLDAPDAAMHLFLEELRASHGTVEGYVASIGADHGTVEALRANLLD
jgi:protein tyrosine/serine phosphatase